MKPFSVGDRVRFYYASGFSEMKEVGVISKLHDNGVVAVQVNGFDNLIHIKQCRRLVRRRRKEITREMIGDAWIYSDSLGDFIQKLEQSLGREIPRGGA